METYTHMHAHTYTHACTHIHTCMHIRTHMHGHTYTLNQTQEEKPRDQLNVYEEFSIIAEAVSSNATWK